MNVHRSRLLALLPLALGLTVCAPRAQQCVDFGSTPMPATWTAAPVLLGCQGAPNWPQWHLYTPPHRAPTPHPGYRPTTVRQLRALLVPYRCTGLLFAPVVMERVRGMGYVVDMAEEPCT
jgi:hypothetical protein